jgi:hypothetical protein
MAWSIAGMSATSLLWLGQPQEAAAHAKRGRGQVDSPLASARASWRLALSARAAADLSALESRLSREDLSRRLQTVADEEACFNAHPVMPLTEAWEATFGGEISRLQQTGEEPAWRAAKERWAGHGVPHHAGHAGWRLAEHHLVVGRRKDAESELSAAYTAAEYHVPIDA